MGRPQSRSLSLRDGGREGGMFGVRNGIWGQGWDLGSGFGDVWGGFGDIWGHLGALGRGFGDVWGISGSGLEDIGGQGWVWGGDLGTFGDVWGLLGSGLVIFGVRVDFGRDLGTLVADLGHFGDNLRLQPTPARDRADLGRIWGGFGADFGSSDPFHPPPPAVPEVSGARIRRGAPAAAQRSMIPAPVCPGARRYDVTSGPLRSAFPVGAWNGGCEAPRWGGGGVWGNGAGGEGRGCGAGGPYGAAGPCGAGGPCGAVGSYGAGGCGAGGSYGAGIDVGQGSL